ncbi:hypothetical protein J2T12_003370 [Paenibacillus anaericanus]|nr:hypothetical protein [Paenibacillus anaericanus]
MEDLLHALCKRPASQFLLKGINPAKLLRGHIFPLVTGITPVNQPIFGHNWLEALN